LLNNVLKIKFIIFNEVNVTEPQSQTSFKNLIKQKITSFISRFTIYNMYFRI